MLQAKVKVNGRSVNPTGCTRRSPPLLNTEMLITPNPIERSKSGRLKLLVCYDARWTGNGSLCPRSRLLMSPVLLRASFTSSAVLLDGQDSLISLHSSA
jgi:hypothetical protein